MFGNWKSPTEVIKDESNILTEVAVKWQKARHVATNGWNYFPNSLFQLEILTNVACYPVNGLYFLEILNIFSFNERLLEAVNCVQIHLILTYSFYGSLTQNSFHNLYYLLINFGLHIEEIVEYFLRPYLDSPQLIKLVHQA